MTKFEKWVVKMSFSHLNLVTPLSCSQFDRRHSLAGHRGLYVTHSLTYGHPHLLAATALAACKIESIINSEIVLTL